MITGIIVVFILGLLCLFVCGETEFVIVTLFGKGSAFFSPAWSAIVIAESYLKD